MRAQIENIKKNSQKLQNLNPKQKNQIIQEIAQNLRANFAQILKANEKDLANFTKSNALKDRLALNEKRLNELCQSIEKIALLDDPIGQILKGWTNEDGLKIEKISIPLGLLCMIYEARPALSAEIVALMIKSSNACIFKGGSEAQNSNKILFSLVLNVLEKYDLNDCFLMLENRNELSEILKMHDLIDAIIPRGSSQMIKTINEATKIPLIKQDKGLCHIFADKSANLNQAVKIIINAKCQRPSVCNALETLLIHKEIAPKLLSALKDEFAKFKLKIYGCKKTLDLLKNSNLELLKADDESFATEWEDFILSIKIVQNLEEAIAHIQKFSSFHSEAILSNDAQNIKKFQNSINSACVYANASTRFSDGGCFGFGGEVGISTGKLHARGPMGVEQITSFKYLITGDGQIRK